MSRAVDKQKEEKANLVNGVWTYSMPKGWHMIVRDLSVACLDCGLENKP